ncbi:MAG TPA: S8 family serine peptidase [Candidatus Acidoferrales bacterium]|nr:S8 family serine peptidase [Candidatus Acidoferrales bacterium]
MKRHFWLGVVLAIFGFWGQPASAQGLLGGLLGTVGQLLGGGSSQGVIVRTTLGQDGLQAQCQQNGCTVVSNLDNGLGQVFLVRPTQQGLLANVLALVLRLVDGILDAEVDQVLVIPPNQSSPSASGNPPGGLWDATPINYYGTMVPAGYVDQPAAGIVRLSQAQNSFRVSGTGIVADIDTGVDPNHPALRGVLLQGYDFTRNQPGGNELNDINLSSPPSCNSCEPAYVNQHTAAMVDQHTAAMLDGSQYAAFGHGTMVAGVIHLVAPTAKILPLKSFHSDGTGNLSDIIRAIYYAVQNNASVINMSFDIAQNSTELTNAINYAGSNKVFLSASSGNDGKMEIVYPAAIQPVAGVASTNNQDQRSSFSNYGNKVVYVAAPGEGIITTYPFGLYAAGWGTSFSSPFLAGTADLILQMQPNDNPSTIAWGVSHAKWVGWNMGYGRLDIYNSLFYLNPLQSLLQ